MRKKKLLTNEEYEVMMGELLVIETPKEARAFHKRYSKYGHGLPLLARYPNLPKYLSYISIFFSMLALLLSVATLL